jgi:hypothetical protein
LSERVVLRPSPYAPLSSFTLRLSGRETRVIRIVLGFLAFICPVD